MCGRYNLTSDPAQLAVELDAVDEAGTPPPRFSPSSGPRAPRYNIAPTTTIPVLARDVPEGHEGPAERVLRAMRWGLVPSWAKPDKKLPNLFNARVESASEKPSFRAAVRRRHCVVPMDGWYEWVPGSETAGGKPGPKQPYYMTSTDGTGLLMAGLWEARTAPDDPDITELSCTILTTAAEGRLQRVHERMPLVVPENMCDAWLDPTVIGDPREIVDAVDLGARAETLELRPVSRAVSSVRNDGPELIRPLGESQDGAQTDGEPPLF